MIKLTIESRKNKHEYEFGSLNEAIMKAHDSTKIFLSGLMIDRDNSKYKLSYVKMGPNKIKTPNYIVDNETGEVVYEVTIVEVKKIETEPCEAETACDTEREDGPEPKPKKENPWVLVNNNIAVAAWRSKKYKMVFIVFDKPTGEYIIIDKADNVNYKEERGYTFKSFEEADEAVEGIYGDRPEIE